MKQKPLSKEARKVRKIMNKWYEEINDKNQETI